MKEVPHNSLITGETYLNIKGEKVILLNVFNIGLSYALYEHPHLIVDTNNSLFYLKIRTLNHSQGII